MPPPRAGIAVIGHIRPSLSGPVLDGWHFDRSNGYDGPEIDTAACTLFGWTVDELCSIAAQADELASL